MRPAYLLAEMAGKFECEITVAKDDMRIDGKSVLSILTLGAAKGTEVLIEASGPDAEKAVSALSELVESGFGMPSAPGPAPETQT